jgi:hypothetical protein
MINVLIPYMSALWHRLQQLREDDRGMTTEAMIITGSLAAVAVVVVAWMVTGIQNRGNSISNSLNSGP